MSLDREKLSNEMMDLADHLGNVLEQPDPRAWEHLLVYCPFEILEAAYVVSLLSRGMEVAASFRQDGK